MNSSIPPTFTAIGYIREKDGLPLEAFSASVPTPGPDQVLIHALASSLNPLDYKLALLNFFGRKPPVVLGFDVAGVVVAVGAQVRDLEVGDDVVALADANGDGAFASGGFGSYVLAREYLATKKPASLGFEHAAALPVCAIAAFLGLDGRVKPGNSVYIPGGGGGVGHLAVQIAANVMGARLVISSGSTPQSMSLARESGAGHVFDYKVDDVRAEIMELTADRGVDVVFDATYSEEGFAATARMVREGGEWVALGVGPGKTTRVAETKSLVDSILADRGAHLRNANMLRFYTEPSTLDDGAKTMLRRALRSVVEWAAAGKAVPHITKTIDGSVEAINVGLFEMRAGKSQLGKTVVRL